MANTITEVIPKILAQGLLALRNMNTMPRLVNGDYSSLASQKGASIDVPIPSAVAAIAVTPGPTPPTDAAIVPTSAKVLLDQWYEAPFNLTDKEMGEAMSGVIPMQASAAIASLADNVNAYILSKYKGVYGYNGTAGTTPFATDTTAATLSRKTLSKQKADAAMRRFVLDPDAEANALNLRAFQDASWRAGAEGISEGNMGRILGFDWSMDQQVPTHTAGTITTGLISKASTAYGLGVKTILATTAASTGACALKLGDIILFAGDTQTYVLTADATQASASTDVTLTFEPGLKVAHVGSEAVTVKASHVVNLAFHRDAIAFATRPLAAATEGLGGQMMSAVDPVTGLALRLEVSRQHKQTRWSFDILYGAVLARPELAVRLAG